MSIINTNLLSLKGQASLSRTQGQLTTAIERLSSGLRVNGAKDDAAGQGIANRMEANLRANDTVSRGINDGISLMQTAEGGLDGINDILQRSRELAVQAANGTLSDSDRASINAEYKELRAEIDRIALGTEAFGKYPLAPAETVNSSDMSRVDRLEDIVVGEMYDSGVKVFSPIPQGITNLRIVMHDNGANDDMHIFAKDGEHILGAPLESGAWTGATNDDGVVVTSDNVDDVLILESEGFSEAASYRADALNVSGESERKVVDENGNEVVMKITYSGDQRDSTLPDRLTESLHIDRVEEPLFLVVAGTGKFYFTEVSWDEKPSFDDNNIRSQGVDIVTSANYGQNMSKETIEPTPADHVSLGLEDVELDPLEKAREAMAKLQEALNQVDGYRGQYGALTNRFESAIEGLATQSVNTASAQSRILDADYAMETSNMVKAQILQQAGNSMLAQANQVPQSVLTLLDQG